MIVGVCVDRNVIDTANCFKLFAINISDNLRWNAHVYAFCAEVASTLYFLKILKRSGLSQRLALILQICHTLSRCVV